MAVYWIGRTKVIEPLLFDEYVRYSGLASQKYPHTTLARGGPFEILEGERYFERFVIHEFPSMEAAREYYNSAEYQLAVKYRLAATGGRCDIVLTEGVAPASSRS